MTYPSRHIAPPLYAVEDSSPQRLDLRALRTIILRRFWLMMFLFLLVGGAVFGVGMMQPRVYTATASLMINPTREQVVDPEQTLRANSPSAAVVDSEVEVLRSGRLAREVVQSLNLEAGWSAPERAGPSVLANLPFFAGAQEPSGEAAPSPPPESAAQQESAARELLSALTVKRRGLSFVIDVSIEAPTPQAAARIANAYLDAYLRMARAENMSTAERASGWLGERIAALRQEVQEKEAAAEQYRTQNGLLTAEGQSLTETQMSDTQQAVLDARATVAESEAQYRQVQALIASGGSGESLDEVLDSNVIRDLRRQEAELAQRQAEYETTLGARHPYIASGRAELENVRGQIRSEIGRIGERMRNNVDVQRSRLATLEGSLGAARSRLISDNDALIRLRQLEREAAAARDVYESFTQRYHEIDGQGQMAESAARVVTLATPPAAPSAPRPLLVAVAAVIAGLVAASLACLAALVLNDTFLSADEVEPRIGLAALSSLPAISPRTLRLLAPADRHPAGYVAEKPLSAYAEAIRVLHAAIMHADPGLHHQGAARRSRVVAFTSALPAEGKTSTALSLARVAALGGQSVIILDGDLRRRSVNEYLGIAPRAGLIEVLAGEKSWRDVTGRDEPTGAHVLPLADTLFSPHDVFNMPTMAALMTELRAVYDLVILDAAPVLVAANVRHLLTHADFAVLVARCEKTNIHATASALQQLQRAGVHVLGVALNQVDPRIPGWGSYGDPLYYDRAGYAYDTA